MAACVEVRDHQPLASQLLDQRPVTGIDLAGQQRPAGIFGVLTKLHHLCENAPRCGLLCRAQQGVDLLGVACQGAFHLPDFLVGLVRQEAFFLAFPQLGQRELQQRQPARSLTHVVQQPRRQAILQAHALSLGRLDNRLC